ncbi:MAG: hypothetical protein ACODAJ_07215 [Planctomycetota bacterium]
MATEIEWREYVEALPEIYREILAAFPRIDPSRKMGYGLGFQTLAAHFEEQGLGFSLADVMQACRQLEEKGLVEIKHRLFVCPTERGERLISVLTGVEPTPSTVPPLPTPPELG